jgi:hypothetical protein
LILTHHQCASTFVGWYLQKVCDLTHLRVFHSHWATARPRPDFDLSLLTKVTYPEIEDATDAPAVRIIRNPLDIIVSGYYPHRSTHILDGGPHLRAQRRVLTDCSKEAGFFLTLAFLERAKFFPDTPGPLRALRTWNFEDTRVRTIRMEDLVAKVDGVLGGSLVETKRPTIELPDPEDFTCERITGGRRVGEVDEGAHYQSGRPGIWRDELPEPIVTYVGAFCRAPLRVDSLKSLI